MLFRSVSETQMEILLANLEPPYALIEQTILSPLKTLARSSIQFQEANRLVQLIYQYKNTI